MIKFLLSCVLLLNSLPDADVTHPRMHCSRCKQCHISRRENCALIAKETLLFYNGRQLLCTRVTQQEGVNDGEST